MLVLKNLEQEDFLKNIKKRDFIATHTFHSPSARKAFFDTVKDRKKNSDWWGNETAEVKEKFLLALKHRKIIDSVDIEKDQSTDYALMLQIFLGKGDFFFCHWKAIDEQAIIDRLSSSWIGAIHSNYGNSSRLSKNEFRLSATNDR